MRNILLVLLLLSSLSFYAQKIEKQLSAHNWKVATFAGIKSTDGFAMFYKFRDNHLEIRSEFESTIYNYSIDKKNLILSKDDVKTIWKIIKLNKYEFIYIDENNFQIELVQTEDEMPDLKKEFDNNSYPKNDFDNEERPRIYNLEELTEIQFEKLTHDFGDIKEEDGDVTYIFKFKNSGNKPLTIIDARGSCGCTVPSFPREPIGVGQSSEIKVVFNPKGKQGQQSKKVTITANTLPEQTYLEVKAKVLGSFNADEEYGSPKKSEEDKKKH
jgi:hypothetical protein